MRRQTVYKGVKATLLAVIAVMVGVGLGYAAVDTYFEATGSTTSSDTRSQLFQYELNMTTDADVIRMKGGDDFVGLGYGEDLLSFGFDSDTLGFYGRAVASDIETISFKDPSTNEDSHIRYTAADDGIEIKSYSGDVVIQLGN
ncbi:MAG TPA: hypothetical protein PKL84_17875 [Candidatus Hydrogenedentes bacterium]|nr:hypothetical protein [Candidatus Hydrogenedentota bacterium]